jgi:hypothetical protein
MAKIELLEPVYNNCDTIYYAGFVNGVYTHFLGYDKLSKKEQKSKLLDTYKKLGYLGV